MSSIVGIVDPIGPEYFKSMFPGKFYGFMQGIGSHGKQFSNHISGIVEDPIVKPMFGQYFTYFRLVGKITEPRGYGAIGNGSCVTAQQTCSPLIKKVFDRKFFIDWVINYRITIAVVDETAWCFEFFVSKLAILFYGMDGFLSHDVNVCNQ